MKSLICTALTLLQATDVMAKMCQSLRGSGIAEYQFLDCSVRDSFCGMADGTTDIASNSFSLSLCTHLWSRMFGVSFELKV